jgi:hypothetical protein
MEMRPVGEVAHVNGLAEEAASGKHGPTKIAAAIVGHADLKLGDRVTAVLEAMRRRAHVFAAFATLRGGMQALRSRSAIFRA